MYTNYSRYTVPVCKLRCVVIIFSVWLNSMAALGQTLTIETGFVDQLSLSSELQSPPGLSIATRSRLGFERLVRFGYVHPLGQARRTELRLGLEYQNFFRNYRIEFDGTTAPVDAVPFVSLAPYIEQVNYGAYFGLERYATSIGPVEVWVNADVLLNTQRSRSSGGARTNDLNQSPDVTLQSIANESIRGLSYRGRVGATILYWRVYFRYAHDIIGPRNDLNAYSIKGINYGYFGSHRSNQYMIGYRQPLQFLSKRTRRSID